MRDDRSGDDSIYIAEHCRAETVVVMVILNTSDLIVIPSILSRHDHETFPLLALQVDEPRPLSGEFPKVRTFSGA